MQYEIKGFNPHRSKVDYRGNIHFYLHSTSLRLSANGKIYKLKPNDTTKNKLVFSPRRATILNRNTKLEFVNPSDSFEIKALDLFENSNMMYQFIKFISEEIDTIEENEREVVLDEESNSLIIELEEANINRLIDKALTEKDEESFNKLISLKLKCT